AGGDGPARSPGGPGAQPDLGPASHPPAGGRGRLWPEPAARRGGGAPGGPPKPQAGGSDRPGAPVPGRLDPGDPSPAGGPGGAGALDLGQAPPSPPPGPAGAAGRAPTGPLTGPPGAAGGGFPPAAAAIREGRRGQAWHRRGGGAMHPGPTNTLTDVAGLRVGHATHRDRLTGTTVILCEEGAVAGVDVRGSATGTRETALLDPVHLVERVHAVVLSGGSAFGLDAAGGVMEILAGQIGRAHV